MRFINERYISIRLINEKYLNEMARVGIFDRYEVYIRIDDPGKIPHFHIRDYTTKGQQFHTCIQIYKPKYFHHTGTEDILNSKMKKSLINFMTSPSKNKRFDNNWQLLLAMWNLNNSGIEVDESQVMPDYNEL